MTPHDMARIWRKALRAEAKGISQRRHVRPVRTQQGKRDLSWARLRGWRGES